MTKAKPTTPEPTPKSRRLEIIGVPGKAVERACGLPSPDY